MHEYRVHSIESAPEKSKQALQGVQEAFGLVPNLAGTMAESPTLMNSFVGVFRTFIDGTFTGAERQTLVLTNAVANACPWAVAFHSTQALKAGVSPDDVRAIRERRAPADRRLAALSALTRALIEKRGHVDQAELDGFARAGFGPDQVLEVIAGLAISTMANYAGNVTRPPVEEPFRAQVWTPDRLPAR